MAWRSLVRGGLSWWLCCTAAACGDDDKKPMEETADASPSTKLDADLPDASFAEDSAVPAAPMQTYYRADTLVLRAPNMVLKSGGSETIATNEAQLLVDATLTQDQDKDAIVDLSMLLQFVSASPQQGSGELATGGGRCPFPVSKAAACRSDPAFTFRASTPYRSAQGCTLEGVEGTATGPCFVTDPATIDMVIPFVGAVPLQEARVMGSWDGENINDGWVRGFLPKSVATEMGLPAPVPPILALAGIAAGTPLTDFLSDSELTKKDGVDGWWFTIEYTAKGAAFRP